MIKIPYPEFFVFYNGTEDYPVESELKLSDAFIFPEEKYSKTKKNSLEILVKVININSSKKSPVLVQCKKLHEYSLLIDYIRENKNKNPKVPLEEALTKAINNGILDEYLKRKSTEVRNMLIAEYSYETDIKVQRREAFKEGAEQKAIETAKNLLSMSLSLEDISKATGLPLEQVEQLAQECKNQK